jgi:hypothetical protein
MSSTLETIPFNFDELYTELQTSFEAQGYDTAEGSNTSQLITAMAYLTSMLNYNTAVNVNEMILPLAKKRSSAAQFAKAIGYEPSYMQSYKYRFGLKLTEGNHTIPKYTQFIIGEKKYYYMDKQLDLQNVQADTIIEINVKEGILYNYLDYPTTLSTTTSTILNSENIEVSQYYIDIPFVDVEDDGIEVFVTYYDDIGSLILKEQWYKTKQFMIDKDSTLKNEFIRLDNINFNTPRIYFSLAGTGSGIREGSKVDINILTTTGVDGAIEDLTDLEAVSFELVNMTLVNIDVVLEGTDYESIESIQENAPLFHNSANRAVTRSDYEAICNRHPATKSTMVWGGDDEFPKCPGHVWFSFLPSTLTRNLSSDIYNYEYLLDNNGDYNWDYTLDNDSDIEEEQIAYKAQVNTSNNFYSNWYLENSEIRSFSYNENNILINPGIWDVLDKYKIPTLEFHNRHPLYLDFEYDIQLLKYNIKTSKSAIYSEVFDVIDNYFTGTSDTIKLEKFETEYFDSSLNKRIDQNITDVTGFNSTLTTKLLVSKKNISKENTPTTSRDLFVQLNVPFEKYFDNDGYLQYNILPNIDTDNFIKYSDEIGYNLYTDWSDIQTDIDNNNNQILNDVIVASIRVHQEVEVTCTVNNQTVFNIPENDLLEIFADFPEETIATYNKLKVYYNGTLLTLNAGTNGFEIGSEKQIILTGVTTQSTRKVKIEIERNVGRYFLFNNFRKTIIVQLFVDARGYNDDPYLVYDYDTPKSYLTTTEGFYFFTGDIGTPDYYLTTAGYVIRDESEVNAVTGAVVKQVTPALYEQSPIKMKLFNKPRYLNFNYNSKNFSLMKNVIPRLKRVTFLQGV